MTSQKKHAILIAGPTASGKSEAALEVARALNGVIINADSMQVYKELSILVTKPIAAAQEQVPHCLYSVVSVTEVFSVADWLRLAKQESEKTWKKGKIPIFTGGTGLYFKAVLNGLADIPDIPSEIRQTLRTRFETEGIATLYKELRKRDIKTAARLKPMDSQRILRALEVVKATGTPLSVWQQKQAPPFPGVNFLKICLSLDKEELNQKIRNRFLNMVEQGVVKETREFMKLEINKSLSSTKALGLRSLVRHIDGEISLQEAIDLAVIETCQYAKRQRTWFKNQFSNWQRVEAGKGAAENILSLARAAFKG